MGVDFLTALIIRSRPDEILIDAGGPSKEEGPRKGKYAGYAFLDEGDRGPRLLISSESVFDTSERAIEVMQKLLGEIKTLDLSEKKRGLVASFSPEEKEAIGKVIALSKKGPGT